MRERDLFKGQAKDKNQWSVQTEQMTLSESFAQEKWAAGWGMRRKGRSKKSFTYLDVLNKESFQVPMLNFKFSLLISDRKLFSEKIHWFSMLTYSQLFRCQ